MNETIPSAVNGERVDRVVATLTGMPRSVVAEAVKRGAIRLDGKPVKARSQVVLEGQVLEVDDTEESEQLPQAQDGIKFRVAYEDEDVLVIDKPEGLVVHPGAGHLDGTLVNGLLARFADIDANRPGQPMRPGIVHRLDAGTTGLLVVSRNETAHEKLVEALKARDVEREYVALVWGDVQPDNGMIEGAIGRGERQRTKMTVSLRGKEARTSYEVLDRREEPAVTLVRAKLETGRTHQIRVHFSAIGHALVGDARYNGSRESIKLKRPFLHAASLAFVHPTTGKQLAFESPLPNDLVEVIQKLELKLPT